MVTIYAWLILDNTIIQKSRSNFLYENKMKSSRVYKFQQRAKEGGIDSIIEELGVNFG